MVEADSIMDDDVVYLGTNLGTVTKRSREDEGESAAKKRRTYSPMINAFDSAWLKTRDGEFVVAPDEDDCNCSYYRSKERQRNWLRRMQYRRDDYYDDSDNSEATPDEYDSEFEPERECESCDSANHYDFSSDELMSVMKSAHDKIIACRIQKDYQTSLLQIIHLFEGLFFLSDLELDYENYGQNRGNVFDDWREEVEEYRVKGVTWETIIEDHLSHDFEGDNPASEYSRGDAVGASAEEMPEVDTDFGDLEGAGYDAIRLAVVGAPHFAEAERMRLSVVIKADLKIAELVSEFPTDCIVDLRKHLDKWIEAGWPLIKLRTACGGDFETPEFQKILGVKSDADIEALPLVNHPHFLVKDRLPAIKHLGGLWPYLGYALITRSYSDVMKAYIELDRPKDAVNYAIENKSSPSPLPLHLMIQILEMLKNSDHKETWRYAIECIGDSKLNEPDQQISFFRICLSLADGIIDLNVLIDVGKKLLKTKKNLVGCFDKLVRADGDPLTQKFSLFLLDLLVVLPLGEGHMGYYFNLRSILNTAKQFGVERVRQVIDELKLVQGSENGQGGYKLSFVHDVINSVREMPFAKELWKEMIQLYNESKLSMQQGSSTDDSFLLGLASFSIEVGVTEGLEDSIRDFFFRSPSLRSLNILQRLCPQENLDHIMKKIHETVTPPVSIPLFVAHGYFDYCVNLINVNHGNLVTVLSQLASLSNNDRKAEWLNRLLSSIKLVCLGKEITLEAFKQICNYIRQIQPFTNQIDKEFEGLPLVPPKSEWETVIDTLNVSYFTKVQELLIQQSRSVPAVRRHYQRFCRTLRGFKTEFTTSDLRVRWNGMIDQIKRGHASRKLFVQLLDMEKF